MEAARSLRFAEAVRSIGTVARSPGWALPTFRSPPGVQGAQRTLRRRDDGSLVVAVNLHGRPWPAVLGDLIEGVVVANALAGPEADRCRSMLWEGLVDDVPAVAA